MGCGEGFSKCILILLNGLVLLGAVLMLAFGITLVVAPDKLISFLSEQGVDLETLLNTSGTGFILNCGVFMIILGSIITVISFTGFAGACCRQKCFLTIYIAFLVIIILAEVALIIFAAVFPSQFKKTGTDAMHEGLRTGFKTDAKLSGSQIVVKDLDDVSFSWFSLQWKLKCCGARNGTDYSHFEWTKAINPTQVIPISCCVLKNASSSQPPSSVNDFADYPTCINSPDSTNSNINIGCGSKAIDELETIFRKYSGYAIGTAIGVILCEIVLIVLACVLRNRNDK